MQKINLFQFITFLFIKNNYCKFNQTKLDKLYCKRCVLQVLA